MKEILFGIRPVVLSVSMVCPAFAYFTDVETSIGNTFTVGKFDLQVVDRDGWFGDVDRAISIIVQVR